MGYEGLYEVSDQGRVRSLQRTVMRSNGSPQKVRRKLLSPHLSQGYCQVRLTSTPGVSASQLVHKLMAAAFFGPSNGLDVRHLDGARSNNVLSNLCYGTRQENVADMRVHGTAPIGERSGHAKLTEAQVRFARVAFKRKHATLTLLAKAWGVSISALSQAVSGANWGHI